MVEDGRTQTRMRDTEMSSENYEAVFFWQFGRKLVMVIAYMISVIIDNVYGKRLGFVPHGKGFKNSLKP